MSATHDRIELNMIEDDTRFYFDLYEKIKEKEVTGFILLGFLPYLSLYVLEAYRYLSQKSPRLADTLVRQHEGIIHASRLRIKLLDNKRANIDDFIEFHRTIVELHHDWMMKDKIGIIGWFKKIFQPDLGVFTYANKVVGSTHVAQLNLGQDPQDEVFSQGPISPRASAITRSVGYDIGEFIGTLVAAFQILQRPQAFAQFAMDPDLLIFKDVKSTWFYAKAFEGISNTSISATLLLILSTLNFLREIAGRLVIDTPATYFKLKFITLFHLSSSINSLQNYCHHKNLHSQLSRDIFAELLSDKDLRKIRRKKDLRNLLVHYKIRDIPEAALDEEKRLFGILEYHFNGMTFTTVNDLVDNQIARLAELMNDWYR